MWAIVTAVTSTLVGCAVLSGLLVRYTLVPYMRAQLIDPILTQMGQVVQIANEAMMQVRVVTTSWDHHQEWSQDEVDRLWKELRAHEHVYRQRRGV